MHVRDVRELSRCGQRIHACSWALQWFIFLKENMHIQVTGRNITHSTGLSKQKIRDGKRCVCVCQGIMAHVQWINTMHLLYWIPDSASTCPEWVWVLQSQVSTMTAESLLPTRGELLLGWVQLGTLPSLTHTHSLSSLFQGPRARQFNDPMSRTIQISWNNTSQYHI
jgi:hypothetical protein